MEKRLVKVSKFLSYVLRHRPESIGLRLDEQGWVGIDELLRAARDAGHNVTRAELEDVVAQNEKRRFAFSEDGARIRASQGHSVEVDLGYEPATPPEFLYHGTADRFLESIRATGLVRGTRHHVHLSPDHQTAKAVGSRHGVPVVLVVRASAMAGRGMEFFVSANGVWLTEHVPVEFIDETDEG